MQNLSAWVSIAKNAIKKCKTSVINGAISPSRRYHLTHRKSKLILSRIKFYKAMNVNDIKLSVNKYFFGRFSFSSLTQHKNLDGIFIKK